MGQSLGDVSHSPFVVVVKVWERPVSCPPNSLQTEKRVRSGAWRQFWILQEVETICPWSRMGHRWNGLLWWEEYVRASILRGGPSLGQEVVSLSPWESLLWVCNILKVSRKSPTEMRHGRGHRGPETTCREQVSQSTPWASFHWKSRSSDTNITFETHHCKREEVSWLYRRRLLEPLS